MQKRLFSRRVPWLRGRERFDTDVPAGHDVALADGVEGGRFMLTNHDREIFERKELHEINQRQSEYFKKYTFSERDNERHCSDSMEYIVTLPCGLGQKAWAILEHRPFSGGRTWRISERYVNSITIFEGGEMSLCLMDSRAYENIQSETGYERNISWPSDKISKELFFLLSEAEEALQNRIQQCR